MRTSKKLHVKNIEILPAEMISVFRRIAGEFQTPAYVYFESELIKNLGMFLDIPAPFGLIVRYAIKANSTAAILALYNKMGAYFDASTFNECIRAVKAAGIDGKKIRLTSQEVQSSKNLKFLYRAGISYTAGSLLQLQRYGQTLPGTEVGIRFNIGIGSGFTPQTSTGGINSSFGIYGQRKEIARLLKKYNLALTTIHLHIGSGSDPIKQQEATNEGLKLVNDYPSVTTLNMGGGYKVAGMAYEHATDINEMGQSIVKAITKFEKQTGRKILLELEPGTALVAKAGYILTKVIDKVSTGLKGKEFLKINGGMNMNARIALYGAQHPLIVIPQDNKKRSIKEYVVVGICCESGDVLTVKSGKPEYIDSRPILEAKVGDLLVIGRAGAYCSSMALGNYNSQQLHPEILVRFDGRLDVIRLRQPIESIWEDERIPKGLNETRF